MKKFKNAYLFDFDNTLVNTFKIKSKALIHTGRKFYNLNIAEEDILKYWGLPFHDFISKLYRQADEVENMSNNYLSEVQNFPTEILPGVLSMIDSVKISQDNFLGIVSAANKELILNDIKVAGIHLKKIDYIQTSADTKFHKPDPRVFEPTIKELNKYGLTKKNALYAGDSLDDYFAARDAGLKFIGVTTGLTSADQFKEQGAAVSESLEDLIDL